MTDPETTTRTESNTLLVPPDWSPVRGYASGRQGRARITKPWRGERGTYWLEGVRGGLFYRYEESVRITVLWIGDRVWMTDEPQYVWSLESFAQRGRGDVLVAGLGLGIVVHQLLANPAVKRVSVIERDPDVVALVQPRLPADSRLTIVVDDFDRFVWVDRVRRDTVIWDLAVWRGAPRVRNALVLMTAKAVLASRYGCPVYVHGMDRDAAGAEFVQTRAFREARRLMFDNRGDEPRRAGEPRTHKENDR